MTISCTTSIDQPIKYSWIKQGVGFQNPPHKNSVSMKPDYYVQNLEKWEITAIKEGSYIPKSGPGMMYDVVYQVLRCFLL